MSGVSGHSSTIEYMSNNYAQFQSPLARLKRIDDDFSFSERRLEV